jgi:glycosyltransferase involved in cell wall biosynthesis
MTLSFVNQTLGIGGAETFSCDLLWALKKFEHVTIEAYTNNDRFAKMLLSEQILVQKTPVVIDIIGDWKGLIKGFLLFPWALCVYARIAWNSRRCDVALLSGYPEKLLFTPLARLFKIPVVWIEFGPLEPIFQKFLGMPKLLYKCVQSLPHAIIVPTNYTKNSILHETSLHENKIIVIPCGSKMPIPKHMKGTKDQNIVCISRMEKGKGQDILAVSFSRVLKKYPKSRLQFIGEGDFLPIVQAKVHALGIHKNVDFLGFVPNVKKYLESAVICVFPSVWPLEGFGVVMIEAMAYGKPVVAFNRGPAHEILEHEKTGLLAKEGDVSELAKKIEMLLGSEQKRKTIGNEAQKVFREKYTIKSVAKKYMKILKRA